MDGVYIYNMDVCVCSCASVCATMTCYTQANPKYAGPSNETNGAYFRRQATPSLSLFLQLAILTYEYGLSLNVVFIVTSDTYSNKHTHPPGSSPKLTIMDFAITCWT